MNSTTSLPLYEVSSRLLAMFPNRFLKIEPHDVSDRESCDTLWIEIESDDSKMSDGEVIKVSPFDFAGKWYAGHDGALRFGGWPTYWDMHGTADEVVRDVAAHLANLRLPNSERR